MRMKYNNYILIFFLLFCTSILFGQENEQKEIRYKLNFIYEYFLIGEEEYPLAPINPNEDSELINILSGFESSKFLAQEYNQDMKISRILINCSTPVALAGGIMSVYYIYNKESPEALLTTGLIVLSIGSISNLIGAIYLQNARVHIFDAVWEYNRNIKD